MTTMTGRVWTFHCFDCRKEVVIRQGKQPVAESRCKPCFKAWQRRMYARSIDLGFSTIRAGE